MKKSVKNFCRFLLQTIVLLLLSVAAMTQNVISGKVTDSKDGTPVPGATVTVKGGRASTQTLSDGTYKLTTTQGTTTLVFTSVGYSPQEIAISGASINVNLVATNQQLNEVVVVGYGAVRKKDLTGSVATVSSKDFNPGLNTSPEQLITGKVAGVSITSNGGQPGQGSTIRIRQGASLNASNDPLIVIDGVPLTGGLKGDGSENQTSGVSNPLALINPADIETFTILKDAASTAIYGSRASNGVIIITTKKGRSGKAIFNFSTQLSGSEAAGYVPALSVDQFKKLINTYGSPSQIAELGTANTNWQKQIYQTAVGTNNNLSVAGALPKINMPYRLSFGYSNQNGILKTDNLERYTGGIRLNPRLLQDHLRIDINLNGAISNQRFANQGAVGPAVYMDPTQNVYQDKSPWGGYFEYPLTGNIPNSQAPHNPLALLEQKADIGHVQKVYGNVQFDYKMHFLPELHANLNLGYEGSKGDGTVVIPNNAAQSWGAGIETGDGYQSKYLQKISNSTFEFYLNYNKDVKSIKSNINATAGYGYYDYLTTNNNYANLKANGDTITSSIPTFPYDKPRYTLLSYYGRVIYTFDSKYILAGSIRTDGSSRFSPQNRWGIFPSIAFTWKINQEKFLANLSALTSLNLRLSYGVTGNQSGIALYSYLPDYSLSTNASLYQLGDKFYHVYAPLGYNADLKWEQTATSNIGLDYGFLNNRINGTIDLYYKKTTNLLNTVNVTPGTNFANQITANVGSMDTKGAEFLINIVPVQTKRMTWDFGFNLAYNERKITKLTFINDPTYKGITTGAIGGGTGNTIQLTSVGHEPNAFYTYQQIYDPKNGMPLEGLYEDQNRDGQINTSDLHTYKSPYARYIAGFSTSFRIDKWTISTVLRSNIGNYVYNQVAAGNNIAALFNNTGGVLQNVTTGIYNTMFQKQQVFSDYYIENASFLKMDNVSVSYNVGKIGHISSLRLSASVQNVFTITKYTGLDPEVYSGIDYSLYPRPRIVVLGVNLAF